MINSIKKYKIQKVDEEINFDKIDKIINYLKNLYGSMDLTYNQEGGKNVSYKDDKYYKKYKKLIKSSEYSIKYYKNFAQEQINKQMQLNQYYANLINVLNVQRDYLLNEYLKLGKNVKNNKQKISMLETMITGLEKYVNTPIEFENVVNKIILKGGDMDFFTFDTSISHEMDELSTHMTNIDEDKNFIENKINELHNRMKNIVEQHENLFKIKTEIDWIVKELENKEDTGIMETQNYDQLYDKLNNLIKTSKEQGKFNTKMADYIHKLEQYSTYLENFVKSNQSVLNTIDTNKKASMDNLVQTELHGGGYLNTEYNKKTDDMYDKLESYYKNVSTDNISINFYNTEVYKNYELEQKTKNYAKLVTITGLIKKLDNVIYNYKACYNYLGDYNQLLNEPEKESENIISLWNSIFSKKNTDYYNKQILDLKFFFTEKYIEDSKILLKTKILTFKEVIKKLNSFNNILVLDNVDFTDIYSDNDKLLDFNIENINNTIVAFDHFSFLLESLILSILMVTDNNFATDVEKSLKDKQNRLLRDAILIKEETFKNFYGQGIIQDGGFINIFYNKTPLTKDENVNSLVIKEFCGSYVSNLMQKSEKPILTNVNIEQINKISVLANMLDGLYYKINLKLGRNNDKVKLYIEEGERIKTYREFNQKITKPEDSTDSQTIIPDSEIIQRPRLDQFKTKLIECKNKLFSYVTNIVDLRYVISSTRKGDFDIDETKELIQAYTNIKGYVYEGINSYIQLIPMIFFTVEFPPFIYKDNLCKYKFSYNPQKEEVLYKFSGDKTACNKIGTFAETDFEDIIFKSQGAFFDSNNSLSTKKIITDPIIGLSKLIEVNDNKNQPINNVLNIMFALGASGTGKTTRYFGLKDAKNPDDRVGIIPYVIKNALSKDKDISKSNVSIAYFVCYGQFKTTNQNEFLIFFNIDEINKDSNQDDDVKYLPYYMPEKIYENVTKYTDFYTNIVTKPINNIKFTSIKNLVVNGINLNTNLNPLDSDTTFRNILTENTSIWSDITPENIDNLESLFNKLVNEQKKINTVMPTKNNIESSRGHTCVLIRIIDGSEIKYFPLFDMAGTEKPDIIEKFFKEGHDINKIAKLLKKINEITQTDKIVSDTDEEKVFPSLNDLLQEESIKKYVKKADMVGGGKKTVQDVVTQLEADSYTENQGEELINKIVGEGKYINHTIGMMIFASMCIGQSIKTTIENDIDNFDNLNEPLFKDFAKYTCLKNSTNCNKTQLLIDKYSYDEILSTSCIWSQIIFSFLYWNEETQESTSKWLEDNKSTQESPYIYDMTSFYFIPHVKIYSVYLLKSSKINFEDIEQKLIEVSTNYSSFLTKPLKIIYNDQNQKIKILYGLNEFKNNKCKFNITLPGATSESTFEYKINIEYFESNKEEIMKNLKKLHEHYIFIENKAKQSSDRKSYLNNYLNITETQDLSKTFPVNYFVNLLKENNTLVMQITFTNATRVPDINKLYTSTAVLTYINLFYLELEKLNNNLEIFESTKEKLIEDISSIERTLDEDTHFKGFLLATANYNIKLKSNKLTLYIDDDEIMNINELKEKSNTLPNITSLESINEGTDELKLNKIKNQMLRIKDGRITATKMILMHLVTGQGNKHFMVNETIELAKTLYESTDLKLNDNEEEEEEEEEVEGGSLGTITPIRELQINQPERNQQNLQGNLTQTIPVFRGGGNQVYKEKYIKYRKKYLKLKYN